MATQGSGTCTAAGAVPTVAAAHHGGVRRQHGRGFVRRQHSGWQGDLVGTIRGAVDQARSHPASRAPPCLSVPVRFILLGVGAMNSPRYAPAGLLVEHGDIRVMIDGGPGAEPPGTIDAWLVTDDRGELIRQIRQLARARGLSPQVARFHRDGLVISPEPVVHTSCPTNGYLIAAEGRKVVWAPESASYCLLILDAQPSKPSTLACARLLARSATMVLCTP